MLHHNSIDFKFQNGYDVCQELSEYEISTKRLASIPDIGKLASTLQRKSHLCIPRTGISWPQSQLPDSCVSE